MVSYFMKSCGKYKNSVTAVSGFYNYIRDILTLEHRSENVIYFYLVSLLFADTLYADNEQQAFDRNLQKMIKQSSGNYDYEKLKIYRHYLTSFLRC